MASEAPSSRSGQILNFAIGAISIGAFLSWLQFSVSSVCCGDFDGYYHIRWSQMLWEGLRHGHLPSFTWLPLTTLNASRYADQHFLYHLLLIPFTFFSDIRWGAKLATVLFAIAAVLSLYWLILRYRIRYPLVWLLALLSCSWLFYVRLSMTRASSLSILFIVAGAVLMLERKFIWLAPAAFLYVWTYNLFVMLGVLSVLWFLVVYWSERQMEWRPVFWTGLGTVAGLVIHPYFPRDVLLFFEHLKAKSGATSMQSAVGSEWYSLPGWQFVSSSMVACAAMVVGYIAFGYALSRRRDDSGELERPLLFLLFSSFLLVITIRFVRFMEYWPPFAVLFAAFALEAAWNGSSQSSPVSSDTSVELPTPQPAASARKPEMSNWDRLTAVVALLAAAFLYDLGAARTTITTATKGADHYRAATDWMQVNIPSGALIYDVNWSDFPKLFFYDTDHRYVSGLDPIYLRDEHPELQELTENLSRRQEKDPATAIEARFAAVEPGGVSYIFVGDYPAAPSPEWFEYMQQTGRFARLYQDSDCVILQILP